MEKFIILEVRDGKWKELSTPTTNWDQAQQDLARFVDARVALGERILGQPTNKYVRLTTSVLVVKEIE